MSAEPSITNRPRRLRLAIFIPVLNGGGAERMMRHLACELARRDIECDLLVATDKGPALDRPPEGVGIVRFHKGNCRRAIPDLVRYLRDKRPDTLLSTVLSANVAAIIAAKMLQDRPRLVIREASRTDMQIGSNKRIRRLLDFQLRKVTYPLADFIVAVSGDVHTSLIGAKLARLDRSRVICNPLTRSDLPTPPRMFKPPSANILACGRLEPEKDYPTLLRAMQIVLQEVDAKLTILGAGSLRSELERLTADLGIQDRVRFEGFVEDTESFLKRASVFVHASRFEGFPSAILEAVAAACPVVATDSPGGAREILGGGAFGTLVPVGDAHGIAKAIVDILAGHVAFPPGYTFARRFRLESIAAEYIEVLFPNRPIGRA